MMITGQPSRQKNATKKKESNYATLFPNEEQFRSFFILFSALDSSKFFQKSGGSEPRVSDWDLNPFVEQFTGTHSAKLFSM